MQGLMWRAACAIVLPLVLCAVPALAQDYVTSRWVQPVSGNWTDATRWSTNPWYPTHVPWAVREYLALIDVAGAPYTVTLDSDVKVGFAVVRSPDAVLEQTAGLLETGSLRVGDIGQGHYRMTGGSLKYRQLAVGGAPGNWSGDAGTGLLELTGGVIMTGGNGSHVGINGGTGTLLVSGPLTRYGDGTFATHQIGVGTGSSGLAHFGGNASVSLGNTYVGGAAGAGTLLIDRARVELSRLYLGQSSLDASPEVAGDGTVILSQGELTLGPDVYIGRRITTQSPEPAGSAHLNVKAGTIRSPFAPIGLFAIYPTGRFTVDGGTVELQRRASVIGGRFDVNRGTVTLTSLTLYNHIAPYDGGTFSLNAGQLTVNEVQVWNGRYIQTFGNAQIAAFRLGASEGNTGTAEARLGGGTFSAGGIRIDSGTFTYQAGSFDVQWMQLTGGRFVATPGANKTLRVGTLSLSGQARLDLGDNRMILDRGTAPPLADVRAMLRTGYNAGAWDGPGIISSVALANSAYGIGYVRPSALFTPLLVAYTRWGDADVDGAVDLMDFNALAANFGATNAFWSQGDFNYDGLVNLKDFNRLAANFGLSASSPEGPTPDDWANLAAAVPEPALVPAAMGLVAQLVRRGRQRGRRRGRR